MLASRIQILIIAYPDPDSYTKLSMFVQTHDSGKNDVFPDLDPDKNDVFPVPDPDKNDVFPDPDPDKNDVFNFSGSQ